MPRAVKNPLKRVICLLTFIERVIHSMFCIMPGFRMSSYFQSTFIESSRHMLERVVTTRSSRDESSTFCTSTSISFTSGKYYTPHVLPLTTRLPLSRAVSALRRLESMRVYWTWMPDSKVCGFKFHFEFPIQNLRRHGQTGKFLFRIRPLLCIVNGKTNPVLKRSGFVSDPKQFPLV